MKHLALAFSLAAACGLAFAGSDATAEEPPDGLVRAAEQGREEAWNCVEQAAQSFRSR